MNKQAVSLGQLIVEKENALDSLFANEKVNAENLIKLVAEIYKYKGKLRIVHLNAHIVQKSILISDQIRQYDLIRGYSSNNNKHNHNDRHDH